MYDSDQKEEDQKEEDQKYYYSDDGEYQEYYYSDDSSAISNKKRDLTDFIDQNDQNLPEESFKQSKANNTRRTSPQVLLCDSNNNILSSDDSVCETVERYDEVVRHHSLSAHILQQQCIALETCQVSHTSSNMSAHVSSSLVENITGALTLANQCHKALESSYINGIYLTTDLLKYQRDMLNQYTDELVSLAESHLLHIIVTDAYIESILEINSQVNRYASDCHCTRIKSRRSLANLSLSNLLWIIQVYTFLRSFITSTLFNSFHGANRGNYGQMGSKYCRSVKYPKARRSCGLEK